MQVPGANSAAVTAEGHDVAAATAFDMPVGYGLERLPPSALGVDRGGTVVFSTEAFRDMLGYSLEELELMTLGEIIVSHRGECPLAKLYAYAENLVALNHKKGHVIWVRASRLAPQRRFDSVALTVFADYTEILYRSQIFGDDRAGRRLCCAR